MGPVQGEEAESQLCGGAGHASWGAVPVNWNREGQLFLVFHNHVFKNLNNNSGSGP